METILTCQDVEQLPSPAKLARELPSGDKSRETILQARKEIGEIISGIDHRLLLIVGPCSIHDPQAALDYAYRLNKLKEKFKDRLCIIMRVYLEKPRSSVGWKGFINDPYMNDSCDLEEGIRQARILLLSITSMGMATGMEFLDPLITHYISDLSSWGAIGARTSESYSLYLRSKQLGCNRCKDIRKSDSSGDGQRIAYAGRFQKQHRRDCGISHQFHYCC